MSNFGEIRLRDSSGTNHADPNSSGQLPVVTSQADGEINDVRFGDSYSIDAFGRLRVSETFTVFDSKQLFDNQPLFWDDQEISGSGTSSAHQANKASSKMSVSGTTAGLRMRQTFQSFNYQPGKSQRLFATCSNLLALSGNEKGFGLGDDKNGLFLAHDGTDLKFIRRTYTTGSAVDTETVISTTLSNGTVLDLTKTMILDVDFEWLGVGRIRAAYVDEGIPIYFFEYSGNNTLSEVYIGSPNLPVRYWIENDGTGAADDFYHICSSVMSEGGQQKNGALRHTDSGSISNLASGTKYAVLGIRLKSGSIGGVVEMENISLITTSGNDKAHWELIFNPTVAGTFTYSDQTNSIVQTAAGSVSNTVTGGTEMDGGYLTTDLPVNTTVPNALKLGAAIDGTVDEVVLTCTPITNNITIQASTTWRELS